MMPARFAPAGTRPGRGLDATGAIAACGESGDAMLWIKGTAQLGKRSLDRSS
jgi:hypothetical protein